MLKRIIYALLLLFATIHLSTPCSEPKYWRSKPISVIAKDVKHIVYGKVIRQYDLGDYVGYDTVEFNIFCILKGGPFIDRLINVTDSNDSCNYNNLEVDLEQILFLKDADDDGAYPTHNPNVQAGALEPTEENFQAVSRSGTDLNVTVCNDEMGQDLQVPCFTSDRDNVACGASVLVINLGCLFMTLGVFVYNTYLSA